ncbi:hypothetical protein INR49_026496 [Caranx melampygus]|nr:hypothetical protein INR49_026496 [Caranx melampygus]
MGKKKKNDTISSTVTKQVALMAGFDHQLEDSRLPFQGDVALQWYDPSDVAVTFMNNGAGWSPTLSTHDEAEQQHEVEQNRGAGGPKHSVLRDTAPQDRELKTVLDRETRTTCPSMHLDVVPDEAAFESRCIRVLDGEVPATEDLKAHVHTVTLPEHPRNTYLRTTMMRLRKRMVMIPARYSRGISQGRALNTMVEVERRSERVRV